MMDQKLITLSGLREIDNLLNLNIRELSDKDAGMVFLAVVNQLYPGIKFGDLVNSKSMGIDLFDKLKTGIGAIKDGVGDVFRDTGNVVGDWAKDIFTTIDKSEIKDQALDAYFISQGLPPVSQLSKNHPDNYAGNLQGMLADMGRIMKAKTGFDAGAIPPGAWIIGGGVLILLMFVLTMRR